jgi:Domain of unknown function (DUF4276)
MKLAIFVEGLTEDIFVENLLREYFDPGKIQIQSIGQQGRKKSVFFRARDVEKQWAEHFCLIIRADNDERVLSKLRQEYTGMLAKGFSAFFGLRDLKSDSYKKYGDDIIDRIRKTIRSFEQGNNVFFHFAKMETEAWFLAAPSCFGLTIDEIEKRTGYNLEEIDPEKDIENPTTVVKRILGRYTKSKDEIHNIVSKIDWEELCEGAKEKGKISFFFSFLHDLEKSIAQ